MSKVPLLRTEARHSSFTDSLQSLLSHLPLLTTTVSPTPSTDSSIYAAEASPPSSASSVYTAFSKQSPLKPASSPVPVARKSPKWTSFHHAYPPPRSRTHSRRRRSQPPLLLQLRRTRPGSQRPRPDLEVYPAHGTIRKERRARIVICGAHELSKEDLVMTRYSSDDKENSNMSPLALELNVPESDGVVAVLHRCGSSCPVSSTAPEELILVHGSAWAATSLATGGYSFTSHDGPTVKNVRWLPRTPPTQRARSVTHPAPGSSRRLGSTSTTAPPSKFKLVVNPANAATTAAIRGTTKALMDPNAIHIPEFQTTNSKSHPSDTLGHTHLTALAVATGIWVAARQGWVELGPFTADAERSGNTGACTTPATGTVDEKRASRIGVALTDPAPTPIPTEPVAGRKSSGGMKMLRFMQRRRASD